MSEEETNAVRLQCGTSAEPRLCLYLVHYVLVSMRSLPNAFNICQGLLFFKKCKYLLGMHLKWLVSCTNILRSQFMLENNLQRLRSDNMYICSNLVH